jgi:hypothetical protein
VHVEGAGFVVNWFADDDEEAAFHRSVAYPQAMLGSFRQWTEGAVPSGSRPKEQLVRLADFAESTARAISPLLETVLVHQPAFFPLAEELGEKEAITYYGLFHGAWATYLCDPVWKMLPNLAPPGWKTEA